MEGVDDFRREWCSRDIIIRVYIKPAELANVRTVAILREGVAAKAKRSPVPRLVRHSDLIV